jgi:hypothetical protein
MTAEMDKFDDHPNEPFVYDLMSINKDSAEYQRDVLLHFIEDAGLKDDLVKYLDEHFPEVDGYRQRKDADT